MKKVKLAILMNETPDGHRMWEKACLRRSVAFDRIAFADADGLERAAAEPYDGYLVCPSGITSAFKQMFDERLYLLENVLGRNLYPAYRETVLHENKRFLASWLKANGLPHPSTTVLYREEEALRFADRAEPPIVAKINIGASGHGVRVLRSREAVRAYVRRAFSPAGVRAGTGPNLAMGGFGRRLLGVLRNPSRVADRMKVYRAVLSDPQRGFVLFQEYVPHSFEWRVVKIGDSYFGHQKIKKGDKASGTKGIQYVPPGAGLLDFVRDVSERFGFNSMAFDLFETPEKGWLVNEMQTVFGHVQSHICERDGVPGRFRFLRGRWTFEPGEFNTNLSYDLRLEDALRLFRKR
jgi:glutathione synthase/RimK-type ligase-like ATP-grasp enzyme